METLAHSEPWLPPDACPACRGSKRDVRHVQLKPSDSFLEVMRLQPKTDPTQQASWAAWALKNWRLDLCEVQNLPMEKGQARAEESKVEVPAKGRLWPNFEPGPVGLHSFHVFRSTKLVMQATGGLEGRSQEWFAFTGHMGGFLMSFQTPASLKTRHTICQIGKEADPDIAALSTQVADCRDLLGLEMKGLRQGV